VTAAVGANRYGRGCCLLEKHNGHALTGRLSQQNFQLLTNCHADKITMKCQMYQIKLRAN